MLLVVAEISGLYNLWSRSAYKYSFDMDPGTLVIEEQHSQIGLPS